MTFPKFQNFPASFTVSSWRIKYRKKIMKNTKEKIFLYIFNLSPYNIVLEKFDLRVCIPDECIFEMP